MLRMVLPGKRKRGRTTRMFTDAAREDVAEVEVTEDDPDHRITWRWKIRCCDTWREKSKEENRNS